MTRGIHLKQLTRAHLELLGLPEGAGQPVQDPPVADAAKAPVPPEQGRLSLGEVPREAGTFTQPRVGSTANPPSLARGAQAEPELDWKPFDLGALTREIRQGLEATLRLLDGSAGQAAMPD